MDVVYCLGKGSRCDNAEIKYSIRSLFKYSKTPIDKIFIIGQKPEFFEYSDKLIHIPHLDNHKKEINLWEKNYIASKLPIVSENFFRIHDDHFLLADFDMETYPNYCRGEMRNFDWARGKEYNVKGGYAKTSRYTLECLQRHNLPTYHFDIHTPNVFNKKKFIETYKFFDNRIHRNSGMLIATTYCNYNKLTPTPLKDVKIGTDKLEWFLENRSNLTVFSSSDDLDCGIFNEFMTELYPEKSPFEK